MRSDPSSLVPICDFFLLIPTSARHRGDGRRRGGGGGSCWKDRRGETGTLLLFIRAVDRPISHADICLSKITFLLMPVDVPRLPTSDRHRWVRDGVGGMKWNRKRRNGDERSRVKVGQPGE